MISIADFLARVREHLARSKTTGRPLFITSNGEAEAVLLSPSAFDELMDLAEMARSLSLLDRSMDDIKADRVRPAKTVIREIADNLHIKLDR